MNLSKNRYIEMKNYRMPDWMVLTYFPSESGDVLAASQSTMHKVISPNIEIILYACLRGKYIKYSFIIFNKLPIKQYVESNKN